MKWIILFNEKYNVTTIRNETILIVLEILLIKEWFEIKNCISLKVIDGMKFKCILLFKIDYYYSNKLIIKLNL